MGGGATLENADDLIQTAECLESKKRFLGKEKLLPQDRDMELLLISQPAGLACPGKVSLSQLPPVPCLCITLLHVPGLRDREARAESITTATSDTASTASERVRRLAEGELPKGNGILLQARWGSWLS